MAITRTIYLQSWAWGGVTYDKSAGGSLRLDIEHNATPLKDRTGTDFYPTSLLLVDGDVNVTVTARDVVVIGKLAMGGTIGNGVATLSTGSGTATITVANILLHGTSVQQGRGEFATGQMVYAMQSSDGTSNPIS